MIIQGLLDEQERWETMKDKKDPIDLAMIEFLISIAKDTNLCSSEQAIADWMILGLHTGFRRNEYAQDINFLNKTRTYERAKDNKARAFILSDFEFRKTKTIRHNNHPNVKITDAQYVFITWRWQKNGDNGQKIPFAKNNDFPDLCPVRAALRIRKRAQILKVPHDHPIGFFKTPTSKSTQRHPLSHKFHFITNTLIRADLRHAAQKVHKITNLKDLEKYSSRSVRIGACVALHMAGTLPPEIQQRLRWRSDTFKDYLRNIPYLADDQINTLNKLLNA